MFFLVTNCYERFHSHNKVNHMADSCSGPPRWHSLYRYILCAPIIKGKWTRFLLDHEYGILSGVDQIILLKEKVKKLF